MSFNVYNNSTAAVTTNTSSNDAKQEAQNVETDIQNVLADIQKYEQEILNGSLSSHDAYLFARDIATLQKDLGTIESDTSPAAQAWVADNITGTTIGNLFGGQSLATIAKDFSSSPQGDYAADLTAFIDAGYQRDPQDPSKFVPTAAFAQFLSDLTNISKAALPV